ncbi:TPM domain-containing protein [Aggregatimonas sangjinii]|uniref:TPM domain-containing protein n=1 Tax=Aggregatimonas sangjinii TaxID=2583587 RepID=A0A5B7SJU0_9FLAO|nr:TPM domain-containing protein [Aggregatimonas sangjinii]QCW98835.1 TPM domain-containing protein [Aggregatimonas sangjinii]
MILKILRIFLFVLALLIAGCKSKQGRTTDEQLFPANENGTIVNDYSAIFSKEEEAVLSKKLYDYEIATSHQIVFVSIDSIAPYSDIQKYATDLSNYWGVGQKDKNNGLMIVLSKPLRQVGIATSLVTEKILTDSICSQVINTTMISNFKEALYFKGISNGIDSLIVNWNQ